MSAEKQVETLLLLIRETVANSPASFPSWAEMIDATELSVSDRTAGGAVPVQKFVKNEVRMSLLATLLKRLVAKRSLQLGDDGRIWRLVL